MDNFGSKSPNRQALGAQPPEPLAFGGWELQTLVQGKWL